MAIVGWIFIIGIVLFIIGAGILYLYAKGFGGK